MRRMVARELHDRVAQTLTGMLVDVENFKSQQVGWDDVLRELDTIQGSTGVDHINGGTGDDQLGDSFVDALSCLVARFEERTTISAELDVRPGWPAQLARPASLNLYRIVEEALANVRMHSGARTVRIVLEELPDGQLAMMIDDDGRGLDTHVERPVGLGTVGMRERAVLLGGRLEIVSEDGVGTTVHAVFPKLHLIPGTESNQELITSGSTR